MAYCQYTGSYYDPAPWTEERCAADSAVPAGCPIHFTDATTLAPADLSTNVVAMNGTRSAIASTITIEASDTKTFSVMDVDSCDCAFRTLAVTFRELAVDVPSAQPGDIIEVEPFGLQVMIGPAGACPPAEWPNQYSVAIACDLCPSQPLDPPNGGGCAAGGDPSLALAALGLLPMLRRFSRRTRQ